ncbi:MAG TPA: plasmid recombination enzyme [Clostridiales bacterium]|nr:plasmid recombination protein [Clostridiales bacterium]HBL81542.1 plasmid recombination enzyme [Clostridiales bacterium]
MAFVILRFSKQKGNPATKIEAHHERIKEIYKSNPDIDTSKSENNIHIITPQTKYKTEVDKRIKESGCRVRKDSTRFVDTLITASPEFFQNMTHDKIVEYFQRAVDFIKSKIRSEMIFSAVIHLDEKTPHMHLCFVPLTDDNRLTAKEILGNRAKLSKWQDEFHEFMVKFYPDLERGTPATLTNRKHIPSYIFKSAAKLEKMQAEIENVLKNTNFTNASKNSQKAIKMIEKWVPMAEAFETKVNMLSKLKAEQKDNKALREAYDAENDKAHSRLLELITLRNQIQSLQKLYAKVPEEIRREIENKKRIKEDRQK